MLTKKYFSMVFSVADGMTCKSKICVLICHIINEIEFISNRYVRMFINSKTITVTLYLKNIRDEFSAK